MIKVWRFLSVSIVLAVVLGLMMVPVVPNALARPGSEWGFEIQPSATTVGFNETFTVNATVTWFEGGIAGASMHLDFDPTLLECTGITIPSTLPNPPDSSIPDRGPGMPVINNTAGYVEDGYSTPLGATYYIYQTFVYATIEFKSKSNEGTCNLTFNKTAGVGTWVADSMGDDYLNWARVVNGTVKVGGPPPTISVSPDNLTFNAIEAGENPPDQTLEVCNSESGTLDWSLTDNAGWLSENPMSGSLGADECEGVTVSVDVTVMAAGDYSATITITGSPTVTIAVSLHIESAAPPVEPANLSVSGLSISPHQVNPGEEVTISINVANTGGETGSYNAILYINSVLEDSQSVSVAPGMTKNVIFTVSKSDAGVYDVLIAGQSGQFEVVSTGWFGGGLGTGGIVAIVVIVIVLIVVLVFVLRRARRAI